MSVDRMTLALSAVEGIPNSALEHGAVGRIVHWARIVSREGAMSLDDLVYLRTLIADLDGAD